MIDLEIDPWQAIVAMIAAVQLLAISIMARAIGWAQATRAALELANRQAEERLQAIDSLVHEIVGHVPTRVGQPQMPRLSEESKP